jgi:hypothetical protein
MPTFNYPTNYELSQIEPDLTARGAAGRAWLGHHAHPQRQRRRGALVAAG